MSHHHTQPKEVWILPEGLEKQPRQIPEEELAEIFNQYEDTGFEPQLKWLYEHIGCSTVDLRVFDFGHLWCDDEGLLRGREVNQYASILYRQKFDPSGGIVGDVVFIVDPREPEGSFGKWVEMVKNGVAEAVAKGLV